MNWNPVIGLLAAAPLGGIIVWLFKKYQPPADSYIIRDFQPLGPNEIKNGGYYDGN